MSKIKAMSTDGVVEKRKYSAPIIKSVGFKVESGFDATLRIGDQGDSEADPPIEPTAGTETYGSESWTSRPFSQQ